MNDLEGFFRRPKNACQLTDKETEIAGLIAQGWGNAEIAKSAQVSVRTVEHHINNIYCKMNARFDCSGRSLRVYLAVLLKELCSKEAK